MMSRSFICGKHILLVEDEADLLEVFEENLIGEGCIVKVAKNGIEAIELAKIHKFDFILSDIRMPELDGTGLLKYLNLNTKKTFKFIFFSGQSSFADEELISMGANDILHKPFNLSELITVLEKHA